MSRSTPPTHLPQSPISVHSTHQSSHLNLSSRSPPHPLPRKKLTQLTFYRCPVQSLSLEFPKLFFYFFLCCTDLNQWLSECSAVYLPCSCTKWLMAENFPNFPEDDLYSIMLVVSYPKWLLQCLLLCHQTWQCPIQTLARAAQNLCSFSSCMTYGILWFATNATLKDCDADSRYCDNIPNLKLTCECILN